MSLFAHWGKIGPDGAMTFGWLMLALAAVIAGGLTLANVRAGCRPYLAGILGGLPFGVMASWCFGYAAACHGGADPKAGWAVVVVGGAGDVMGVLRRAPAFQGRTGRRIEPA